MVVCVLVWAFCIVSVTLAIVLHEFQRLLVYAALPAPVFIFCSAQTFRALPAANSMPTEEKERSLGTLILLFFNYFLGTVPTMIFDILVIQSYISWILFLLGPFLELILFSYIFSACLWCVATTASDEEVDDECGLL